MPFPKYIQSRIDECRQQGITFEEGSRRRGWLYVRNITEGEGAQILEGERPKEIDEDLVARFKPIYGNSLAVLYPLDEEGNLAEKEGAYAGMSSLFIQNHKKINP